MSESIDTATIRHGARTLTIERTATGYEYFASEQLDHLDCQHGTFDISPAGLKRSIEWLLDAANPHRASDRTPSVTRETAQRHDPC